MDKQEFTGRVHAVSDTLYRIACGQLRDHNDRCDAVQEAVLKAWSARRSLREAQYFETWLIRILINECHAIQRRSARVLPMESVPEPASADDSDHALREAVMALPEKLRMPVILHYMEGYDSREIARMLRIPAGTVRTRLMRARTLLKSFLDDEY